MKKSFLHSHVLSTLAEGPRAAVSGQHAEENRKQMCKSAP